MSRRASGHAIVDDRTFILVTRETGYRGVATAVAELVDNSLQADARTIDVLIRDEGREFERITDDRLPRNVTIAVVDDGCGMGPEALLTALQFGGTSRFDDRSGFGRFGMGLPNSSVSQTRRLDIYSWKAGAPPFYSYLDVDEIASGRARTIPAPQRKPLPDWLAIHAGASGTAVLWSRCDRLGRARSSTIAEHLKMALGRMFRYAVWSGARLRVNHTRVAAVDPLFLHGRNPLNAAVSYGGDLRYAFTDPASGLASTVEIHFTELPINKWHSWTGAEKRKYGIVGGAGVSVVRAGREIDYGWHFMGTKRRENYDDWWRCEVRFSPALDELFGVTHSKQRINPTAELRNTLSPDLETIARTLNARARAKFESLQDSAPTRAVALASSTDQFLEAAVPAAADRIDGLRYRIELASLSSPAFYEVRVRAGTLTLTLNQEHPFFKRIYEPACASARERERFGLECLLLAAARADVAAVSKHDGHAATRLRVSWADSLAALLDRATQ